MRKKTKEIVYELNAQGKSRKEIAQIIGITEDSVRYHLRNKKKNHQKICEKKMVVEKLKAQGKTIQEIVEVTGYNKSTVRYHYFYGESKKDQGSNADRHLCKTCKWRDEKSGSIWCDYYWKTKKSRPCEAENCSVYEKGDPGPMKVVGKK